MAGLVAFLYGIVAYGVTLVALLYLIGFTGNLIVPKSIDSGTAGPLLQSVILDTLLIALFAIQHSVMARPPALEVKEHDLSPAGASPVAVTPDDQ